MFKIERIRVAGFKTVIMFVILLVRLLIFLCQLAFQRIFQCRSTPHHESRGEFNCRNCDVYVNVDRPAICFISLLPMG